METVTQVREAEDADTALAIRRKGFRLMRREEAIMSLCEFVRSGDICSTFDLVQMNVDAALIAVRGPLLSSLEGRGWNLGAQAVHFHNAAALCVQEIPTVRDIKIFWTDNSRRIDLKRTIGEHAKIKWDLK
jgi:hypothetical protein